MGYMGNRWEWCPIAQIQPIRNPLGPYGAHMVCTVQTRRGPHLCQMGPICPISYPYGQPIWYPCFSPDRTHIFCYLGWAHLQILQWRHIWTLFMQSIYKYLYIFASFFSETMGASSSRGGNEELPNGEHSLLPDDRIPYKGPSLQCAFLDIRTIGTTFRGKKCFDILLKILAVMMLYVCTRYSNTCQYSYVFHLGDSLGFEELDYFMMKFSY